ncbi:hypothetical protein INT45_011369 [Circinella minor]|uniref:Uncharacterized protein n=1 Tax=Circinella minor TaxID=1195481 RepID=A0A8H7VGT2_9FUNG|nr:hypothetical protein INT45_011369 [Circinella minor]
MVVSRSRPVMCETPIMVKKQEEEKCPIKYFSFLEVYGHKRRDTLYSHIYDTGPLLALGLNLGLRSWADILSGASAAKVSAYVQHQNDHSLSLPTDTMNDAFLLLSLKHDAIVYSLLSSAIAYSIPFLKTAKQYVGG